MTDVYMRIAMGVTGSSGVLSALKGIGSALGSGGLGGALVATTAAAGAMAVSIGVTAVKAAADYQTSLTTLVTGAGESSKNLNLVSNGMLNLAVQTATTTQQLSAGMFAIESSGQHGAAGLRVLQVAAEGAKVGNADLGVVANALTTEMTDYHFKANQAAMAMNGLTATVANGKTTLSQLAPAMGTVLPIAAKMGISFPQVAGALATMTNAGIPAQHAAQNLASALTALSAPNATAVKSMQSVGLTAQQVKDTLSSQGLTGALQLIEEHVGKTFPSGSVESVKALKNIMGGMVGLKLDTATGGASLATFEANANAVAAAMKNGGNAVTGWSLVQSTFNFKIQQAQEVVQTFMIRLGQQLLPTVTALASAIIPLLSQFSNWITSGQALHTVMGIVSPAIALIIPLAKELWSSLSNLAAVVIPLVVNFGHWLVASGALHTGLVVIGVAITVVVTVISGLINALASIIHFFSATTLGIAIFRATLIVLGTALTIVAAVVIPFLVAALVGMGLAAVTTGIEMAIAFAPIVLPILAIIAVVTLVILAVQHWGAIAHWIQGVWSAALSWLTGAMHAIGGVFSSVWAGIESGARIAWNVLVTVVKVGAALLLSVILGPFLAIGALFIWLYNHNYYFKALIDSILSVVKSGLAALQTAWTTSVNFVVKLWDGLVKDGTTAFNSVKSAIMTAVNDALGALRSAWDTLSNDARSAWNSLVNDAVQLWNSIAQPFTNAWSQHIGPALSSLWSQMTFAVGEWIVNAASWGANLIQGFINGILSKVAGVGQAVAQVASKVASFLGFHSPAKEGPGTELDAWPRNFVASYAAGLRAGAPQIQAAMNDLTKPLLALNLNMLPTIGKALNTALTTATLSPTIIAGASGVNTPSPTSVASPLPTQSSAASTATQSTTQLATLVYSLAQSVEALKERTPEMTVNNQVTLQAQSLDNQELERAGRWMITYLSNEIRGQFGNI